MKKHFKFLATIHPRNFGAGYSPFTPEISGQAIHHFLFFTFCFLLISACTTDPPPTLNYKDRQLVDSLFTQEVDSLKPLLDSLCDLRFDSAVQHTVDSILKERQSDRDKYLERLKKGMNGKD